MTFMVQTATLYLPGKLVVGIYAVLSFALGIPAWLLWYIIPGLRPNPQWTWRQALRIRLVNQFIYNMSLFRPRTPERLTPGKEGSQFTVISPAAASHYTGILTKDVLIKPVKIGATWYPKPMKSGEQINGYVTLHFHGGAYVIGDGRKYDCGFLAHTLNKHAGSNYVLCPQYRLACNPGNKFPAQIQDAVSSYIYLTKEMGVDPKKVVVSGDSAGGNLTLALLKYIEEHGEKVGLQKPGAISLWSPWPSPVRAFEDPYAIFDSPNHPTDYLNEMFGHWGAECLAPRKYTGLDLNDPYISFLGQPYKTSVPIIISTGESEALFHDNIELYEEFKAVGNTVEHVYIPNAVHDIILIGDKISMEKEASKAAHEVGTLLKKHL